MKRNTNWILLFVYIGVYNLACSQAQEKLPHIQPTSVFSLDNQVDETSGLIYFNHSFWTINDSGNSNILYAIDAKNGKVIQKIEISDSQNIDWEELSEDQNYLYIADIGDNNHNRKKKQIYRIAKSDLTKKGDYSVKPELISFAYPAVDGKQIDFNAEAIFILDGKIHVLTKDLFVSYHFTIPAIPGSSTASYIEKFSSNGMVTGASIDLKTKAIFLVGYKGFGDRLLWKFSNCSGDKFLNETSQTYSLGDISNTSQVEAVCFKGDGKIYLTNETFLGVKQQLWELDENQLKMQPKAVLKH